MSQRTQPTYDALAAHVRGSPVVTADETGWKVGGHPYWLWACATPDTTIYAIEDGRGFAQAARLLGAADAGVLVRDGWAPDRRFTQAAHQTCLVHYADVRIMPTLALTALSAAVIEPTGSA